MNYKILGGSDLRVSRIGFGCMSLGEDQDNNTRLIHSAIDLGLNFLDTADLYNKGMNERAVGTALKGKRDQVILATKVGNRWRPDGGSWDWVPGKKYILESINKSLERLQTEQVDLYQLHGGTIEDPIDEIIETFELLKQQGKIRYYGLSSIRPNVIREYVKRSSITSVMMQYSLLDRRPEETCLDLLAKNNIGVLTRGSIAQGFLVNKAAKEYLNLSKEEVSRAATAVLEVSGKKRTAAQTALCFVLQHPAITSAVVGIRTMNQLEEVVNTMNAPLLTEQELKSLQQSINANVYEQHR